LIWQNEQGLIRFRHRSFTYFPLIRVKGSQIGRTEPRRMGKRQQIDWLQIAGYASLIVSALALFMVFTF